MSVTIDGMEELFRTLTRVAAIEKLDPPMQRSVLRLEAYMKDYPPPPPGSRYIRGYGFPGRMTSEKLGPRWTSHVDRRVDGLIGRVGNNASYAPLVQSRMFQTRQHARTGWRTDARAIRENEAAIRDDFQAAVDAAVRG